MKDKIAVFIDNSNLFHAVRNTMNANNLSNDWQMNYDVFMNAIEDGRTADYRFYYSAPEDGGEKPTKFYHYLSVGLGFMMTELPLRYRSGKDQYVANLINQMRKERSDEEIEKIAQSHPYWLSQVADGNLVAEEKGLDCEIVYDMVRLAERGNYGTFVLVAGDEDYARTVMRLRRDYGLDVEVAFFANHTCSNRLIDSATSFLDLNETKDLFELKRKT